MEDTISQDCYQYLVSLPRLERFPCLPYLIIALFFIYCISASLLIPVTMFNHCSAVPQPCFLSIGCNAPVAFRYRVLLLNAGSFIEFDHVLQV